MFPKCYRTDEERAADEQDARRAYEINVLQDTLKDIMDIASDPAFQSDAMGWIQQKCQQVGIQSPSRDKELPTQGEQYVHAIKTIVKLRTTLREAIRRFKLYEMDVDTEPPRDHRAFMQRASALLVDSSTMEGTDDG